MFYIWFYSVFYNLFDYENYSRVLSFNNAYNVFHHLYEDIWYIYMTSIVILLIIIINIRINVKLLRIHISQIDFIHDSLLLSVQLGHIHSQLEGLFKHWQPDKVKKTNKQTWRNVRRQVLSISAHKLRSNSRGVISLHYLCPQRLKSPGIVSRAAGLLHVVSHPDEIPSVKTSSSRVFPCFSGWSPKSGQSISWLHARPPVHHVFQMLIGPGSRCWRPWESECPEGAAHSITISALPVYSAASASWTLIRAEAEWLVSLRGSDLRFWIALFSSFSPFFLVFPSVVQDWSCDVSEEKKNLFLFLWSPDHVFCELRETHRRRPISRDVQVENSSKTFEHFPKQRGSEDLKKKKDFHKIQSLMVCLLMWCNNNSREGGFCNTCPF